MFNTLVSELNIYPSKQAELDALADIEAFTSMESDEGFYYDDDDDDLYDWRDSSDYDWFEYLETGRF